MQKTRLSQYQSISIGQLTYRGDGYRISYPANARIDSCRGDSAARGEILIRGPQLTLRPAYEEWTFEGPAYELRVQCYDNPGELDAEEWGRSYLLGRARQEEWSGSVPLDADGAIIEEEVGKVILAEQLAFWANLFGGDSTIRTFFLARGKRAVLLSFHDYPLANQPIAPVQQDIYGIMMASFRFEDE